LIGRSRDGEDHLAVGEVLEQLVLSPLRPQQLALLMTARAQPPELAGERDEKLVPALRAAHPGDALVEDAAIEIAVDCRLDAGSQVSVTSLKSRLICTQESLEVVGECPVEEGALGMVRTVDAGSCSRCDRLHS
jgi:hypothetical protein